MKKRLLSLLLMIPLIFSCNKPSNPSPQPDPEKDYWPTDGIKDFLNQKGISGVTIPGLEIKDESIIISSNTEHDDELQCDYYLIKLDDDYVDDYVDLLTLNNFTFDSPYYVDENSKVAIGVDFLIYTNISIYDYNDIQTLPPEPEEDLKNVSYGLYDLFGKAQAKAIGPIVTKEGFSISAVVGDGTTNPFSVADSNGRHLRLYKDNIFQISTSQIIRKIEFYFEEQYSTKAQLTVNNGEIKINDDKTGLWTGKSSDLEFTAVIQCRIASVKIYYIEQKIDPKPVGYKTISEVYEMAEEIRAQLPKPLPVWYLTEQEVIVDVEAIDAIDSVATGGILDGNARCKTLVVDDSGYIICSSGNSKNNPISFYQRAKKYIPKGTATYEVVGKIAFFNDVVEIKVTSYEYDPTIVINKDFDKYSKNTFTESDQLIDDILENAKPNEKGYGVNDVIKMTGLTYFNKYNSAGSYYFLDQDGMIVPVYSLEDKDRSSLSEGYCYDIYGFETLYQNRPSLRVLKVEKSTLNPASFNFDDNVVEVSDLTQFYNIGQSTDEKYTKSGLTVYKAEVYVSSYAYDKYTFNTTYTYFDGQYTTGITEEASARNKSLGIFNEDLDFKRIFLDFDISECRSEEEVESKKVTLYFTLATVGKINGLNYWRVNVFEDLVFSYEYYKAPKVSMIFDTDKSECIREDGVYQTWNCNGISVTNATTDQGIIQRDTEYLKIVNDTSLTITYPNKIIGFKINTGTFSGIQYFEGLDIKTYHLFSSYFEVVLNEPTDTIEISYVGVNNGQYLKVIDITIAYQN